MTRARVQDLLARHPVLWLAIPFILLRLPGTLLAKQGLLALGFVCFSITFLCSSKNDARVYLAGSMFGLALAAKITFILSFPILIAFLWIDSRQPRRDVILYLLFAFLAFVFACPFIWTEPIRLGKAIIGLSLQKGEQQNLIEIIKVLREVLSLPVLALLVFGGIHLWLSKRITLLLGCLITFALSLAIFSRAHGIVFDRYFMPCWPAFLFLLASGLDLLASQIRSVTKNRFKSFPIEKAVLASLFVVIVGSHLQIYARSINDGHRDQLAKRQMFHQISSLNCKKPVYVPFELFPYISKDATAQSLGNLQSRLRQAQLNESASNFGGISRQNIDLSIVDYLPENFNENERTYGARLRMMEYTAPKNGTDVQLWHKYPAFSRRFGFPGIDEIYTSIRTNNYCALILPIETPSPEGLTSTNYSAYKLFIAP